MTHSGMHRTPFPLRAARATALRRTPRAAHNGLRSSCEASPAARPSGCRGRATEPLAAPRSECSLAPHHGLRGDAHATVRRRRRPWAVPWAAPVVRLRAVSRVGPRGLRLRCGRHPPCGRARPHGAPRATPPPSALLRTRTRARALRPARPLGDCRRSYARARALASGRRIPSLLSSGTGAPKRGPRACAGPPLAGALRRNAPKGPKVKRCCVCVLCVACRVVR